MLLREINENGRQRFEFKRESFKEFFVFKVGDRMEMYMRDRYSYLPIPRGFSGLIEPRTGCLNYYHISVYPFVWVYFKLQKFYYRMGRKFVNAGMLDKKEGASYPSWWPLRLHLPKKNKNKKNICSNK